ncbi:MAG: hypothetical protein MK185_10295 [Saccharospirillaceae bacterium]|nr:hypothetical protein [Saccharospirillaceae bacterium]
MLKAFGFLTASLISVFTFLFAEIITPGMFLISIDSVAAKLYQISVVVMVLKTSSLIWLITGFLFIFFENRVIFFLVLVHQLSLVIFLLLIFFVV